MENNNFETEQLYNQMFNALVVNIYSKSRGDKTTLEKIYLNDILFDNKFCSVMMFAANTASTIWGGKIYIHTSLWRYIKWKWPRRKTHTNYRWTRKKNGLGTLEELNFVAKGFGVDIRTWLKIYKEFFTTNVSDQQ